MKKTLLLSFFAVSALFACSKEEEDDNSQDVTENVQEDDNLILSIEKKQNATMFFYTSTGCPGCGSWGIPTFKNVSEEHVENVIPVGVHIKYGDPFITDVSEDIAANREGSRFTPQLFIGNETMTIISGGYIDGQASLDAADDHITTTSTSEPVVSCGSIYEVVEGTARVKYGAQFHQDTEGEYYLASYLLEDKLMYDQAGADPRHAEHSNVIRKAISSGSFGDLIELTSISADELIEKEVSFAMNEEWNTDNLELVTIVWKKEGDYYTVVNSSYFKL